jgi:DNA (cytosine-5)-methyltransferase 1
MGEVDGNANAGGQVAVAFAPRVARNGRGAPEEVVPPLKTQSGRTGKGDSALHAAGAFGVRRLTPRECERLQGFPDDWTLVEYRGKPAADGPRYKALGNAMAVSVVRWIGERVRMHLEGGET